MNPNQHHDHILATQGSPSSTTFLFIQTPKNDHTLVDFQPRAQIKRKLEAGKLKCGDGEAIKKFSNEFSVPEKLVTDYVDHV